MRLMLFDRTCRGRPVGLTECWSAGARLYHAMDRLDASLGAARWDEALAWVTAREERVRELQFWGHGKWGCAFFGRDSLDASALTPGHALHPRLLALRDVLAPGALVWFRACETFGADRGIDFAERLADFLGARVAGHTRVIGFHQSGLHGLAPGVRADWSPEEGLARGTAARPERALGSSPFAPRTITCLEGRVPEAWFAGGSP